MLDNPSIIDVISCLAKSYSYTSKYIFVREGFNSSLHHHNKMSSSNNK